MNLFDEISDSLPNGFHDALLKSIFINYESDEIRLNLDICIGNPDDPIEEKRDLFSDIQSTRSASIRTPGF